MKLQIDVIDIINTGMVEMPNKTYYSTLNMSKFFYSKQRIFSVHLELDNEILFRYNGIPMGYMIKEHAPIYRDEIRLWESLINQHRTFEYYAEVIGDKPHPEQLIFGDKGSKLYVNTMAFPIKIHTSKG